MYQMAPAAYIFTHVYMNTMQQGIQSLHVVGELVAKYGQEPESKGFADLMEWASQHKVVRILSAGGTPEFFTHRENAFDLAGDHDLPYASFTEPDNYNQVTAFGFIVTPELCFEIEQARSSQRYDSGNILSGVDMGPLWQPLDRSDDFPIVQFLKSFHSAR